MSDKKQGLPSPEASKNKLMDLMVNDLKAPVEKPEEKPVEVKKSTEAFTVKATRNGFFKGNRISVGQIFKCTEIEFSKNWMVKI